MMLNKKIVFGFVLNNKIKAENNNMKMLKNKEKWCFVSRFGLTLHIDLRIQRFLQPIVIFGLRIFLSLREWAQQ